jgi:hypothetical protein
MKRAPLLELGIAVLAALAVRVALSQPFAITVAGATPSGRVHGQAVVSIPGVPRGAPVRVRIEVDARALRLGIDEEALIEVRASPQGVVMSELPPTGSRGARLRLAPLPGEGPFVLRKIDLQAPVPAAPSIVAFLATLATGIGIGRIRERRLALACALAMAGFGILAAAPHLLAAAFLVPSAVLGFRVRSYLPGVLLLGALVFGAWVRLYFLPSAGSWDTEYWKAWMSRAVTAGVPRVYGDSDATPDGHFVSHLLGREKLFQIEYKRRDYVVDYPPLAMALWQWSWRGLRLFAPSLDRGEAENVAVKLPAVLGDLLSILVLLSLFRQEPGRGLTLGALYWSLPLSWLPSAVLGFLDAAYAPFALLGLVAAGKGRGMLAGALIALAALIKPQALLFAPAALLALESGRARAIAAGFAVAFAALVPFALAGTLEEAVTHVFRILFQHRLSAGYANPWWVLGHLANGGGFTDRIEYATLDAVGFPAGVLGTASFLAALAFVLRRAPKSPFLAGAGSVLAYGVMALGVHENHPHPMFLAFLATGLRSRRLRAIAGLLAASYVLNMLALSGIGRFYGLRYLDVESLAAAVSSLRMGLGFDLTLALAILNTVLFAVFLAQLDRSARRGRVA